MKQNSINVRKITYLAALTAIVVVLQLAGSFIRFGIFSISAVLVPIVMGSALCGAVSGAWLGLVFAIVVLVSGDATAFMVIDPFGTVLTVILKGVLCGLCAGIAYKLLSRFNKYLAVIASAVVCPLVNTGVFLIGSRLFFWETVAEWAGSTVAADILVYLVGLNFPAELVLNIVLAPVILRLLNLKLKK